jgi:hypothetical protein
MSMPGFGATASLYKASTYYCLANGWPSVAGAHFGPRDLTPQAGIHPAGTSIRHCGDCYRSNGECVMDCTICLPCPKGVLPNGCGGCTTETVRCEGSCPPPPPPVCCPPGCVMCP